MRNRPESAQRRTVSVLTPSNSATCPTRYVFTGRMVRRLPPRSELKSELWRYLPVSMRVLLVFQRRTRRDAPNRGLAFASDGRGTRTRRHAERAAAPAPRRHRAVRRGAATPG